MDTRMDEIGATHAGSGNGRGRYRRGSASREIAKLIADVEALVARLVNAADPEIERLRDQVERTVFALKGSLAESADSLQEDLQKRARKAVSVADDHVRRQPWSTLAIVGLAALAIGFLTARR
jgi:ElaB/YqjD/DUF883 family membrane-anchored ribosome-binding protein